MYQKNKQMTRIMKKIYNILLTTVAMLAFAPVVSAQTDWSINGQIKDAGNNNANPEYPAETTIPVQIDKDKAVAYSKNISKPFSDGTYWIKLETFATGSASYTVSNEPADIVLVLDFSGSMTSRYSTTATYTPVTSNRDENFRNTDMPAGSWDYNNISTTHYYKYQGNYYQVFGGRVNGDSGNYFLYFTVNGTRYYLDRDHVTTDMPTEYTTQYQAYWGSALYIQDNSVTRLEALKAAVADFVEVIYHNDNYEDDTYDKPRSSKLGNRISIVVYSADSDTDSHQLAGWTDVTTASGTMDIELIRLITAEGTHTGTYSNRGMTMANTLLSQIDSDRRSEASQTVVLFTDGLPGNTNSWTNTSTEIANGCIAASYIAKNTYGATVFTVAIYNNIETQTNMYNYMRYTSSNYPYAESMDEPGVISNDESISEDQRRDPNFFKEAGDDLSGVFQEIAKQSGGSSNTSLSAATSTVDVVSSSFMLPTGADASSIKVFTAKCTYADPDNGTYTFNTETLVDHSNDTYNTYDSNGNVTGTYDVDAKISVDLGTDADGNPKIEVVGFDYSNNWCGPVTDENGNVTYQGHKVIIMIPVQMNPDAVGGPNVATNTEGSGIYVNGTDDDPLIPFVSPTVSLPVNIYIEKTGLNHGESAKFKIERAQVSIAMLDDLDPETLTYTYVSTVFVTQPETATDGETVIVKVKGLPANVSQTVGYIYKVTEEEWAWSYKRNTQPQYTVTSKVENPFTFDNEKKNGIEMILHHAESKADNIFKASAATKEYNDSKSNSR